MTADKKLEVLGIVGARSGSKGMLHKNITPLAGKPLMAWIMETAQKSRYINRLILSTDSPEYAEVGKKYGAEAPFLRPAELAADTSIVGEFILHALEWLEKNESYTPDLVVYLSPTVPLVRSEDIDTAIELLLSDEKADSAILASPSHGSPHKMVKLASDGKGVVSYITRNSRDVAASNRQAYEKAFNRESLPIVSRVSSLRRLKSQSGDRVLHHLISQESAFDIDTPTDFFIAEQLMLRKLNDPS